jgi:hypothetical protein
MAWGQEILVRSHLLHSHCWLTMSTMYRVSLDFTSNIPFPVSWLESTRKGQRPLGWPSAFLGLGNIRVAYFSAGCWPKDKSHRFYCDDAQLGVTTIGWFGHYRSLCGRGISLMACKWETVLHLTDQDGILEFFMATPYNKLYIVVNSVTILKCEWHAWIVYLFIGDRTDRVCEACQ